MEEIELKKRYYPIMECWRMIKEFQNAKGTEDECERVTKKAQEIYEKSGKTEFAKELMVATVNEIERMMMEEKKHG